MIDTATSRPTVALAACLALQGGIIGAWAVDRPIVGFLCAVIMAFVLLRLAREATGSYTNLYVIFTAFFTVYGLAGPFQVITGSALPSYFGEGFDVPRYSAMFGTGALAIAFASRSAHHSDPTAHASTRWKSLFFANLDYRDLLVLGSCIAAVASIAEVVNLHRIGGLWTLGMGKAYYQSQIVDLEVTLPTARLVQVSAAVFGVGIAVARSTERRLLVLRSHILAYIVCSGVALSIAVILGRRGILLSLVLILVLATTTLTPIRKLGFRLVVFMVMVYLVMGIIYANRSILGYTMITGRWDEFWSIASDEERLKTALTPGLNEFGSQFGNVAVYLREGGSSPRWGESYLKGLVLPIPGFLYPGTKPRQITYEFRDRYFPERKLYGEISSTGFSALLEAYMNFRWLGIFLVFFAYSWFLRGMEAVRASRFVEGPIVYSLLGSTTQLFHRSPFGDVFGTIVSSFEVLVFFLFIFMIVRKLYDAMKNYHGIATINS